MKKAAIVWSSPNIKSSASPYKGGALLLFWGGNNRGNVTRYLCAELEDGLEDFR